MKSEIQIEIDYTDRSPVYLHYPEQVRPQQAWLELDADGTVSTSISADPGGHAHTFGVAYGRTVRWAIPPEISGQGLSDLIDEIRDDLQTVHGEHETWDNGLHICGRLTDAGQEVAHRIQAVINDGEWHHCQHWDAGEWLDGSLRDVDEFDSDTCTYDDVARIADSIMIHGDGFEPEPGVVVVLDRDNVKQFVIEQIERAIEAREVVA